MDNKSLPRIARERLLTIGAFSAATNLSQKALRLYDRQGLLKPAYTDSGNGYRYYSSEQIGIAQRIVLMRQMEMPLLKIRRMLAATPSEAGNMAMTYTQQMEERGKRIQRGLTELIHNLQCDSNGGRTMSETSLKVETREIPAQLVLSLSRRTKIEGLREHVQESPKRLQAIVLANGGEITGGAFGIFHGPVNKEDDGPMEVCLPVNGAYAPSGDIVLRELPGGPAVLVSGGGRYCEFPGVLELYDAAHQWITQKGYVCAGPPREWWQGPNGEEDQMTVVWFYQ